MDAETGVCLASDPQRAALATTKGTVRGCGVFLVNAPTHALLVSETEEATLLTYMSTKYDNIVTKTVREWVSPRHQKVRLIC